jgi:hypothetical protein
MSFIKRWNVDDIQHQLSACSAQVNSRHNDGFTAWYCKQDLLVVKYQLDELLRTAPKFAGEEEFVAELDKKLVWQQLRQKTT